MERGAEGRGQVDLSLLLATTEWSGPKTFTWISSAFWCMGQGFLRLTLVLEHVSDAAQTESRAHKS